MLSRFAAVLIICGLVVFGGCKPKDEAQPAVTAADKPRPAATPVRASTGAAKDFQTLWQTEPHYIMMMVAADLGEMAYYAKHGRVLKTEGFPVEVSVLPARTEPPVYTVTVRLAEEGEVTCELPMTTPIWAPATYRPLVQLLMAKLKLSGAPFDGAVKSDGLLGLLQNPRVEILAKADVELSAKLATAMTSAERHEEAALLLGAFTLRETDGLFFQVRAELGRMTAHLALAGGLRGEREPTLTGRVAEATLTALYNNQAAALTLLDNVPDSDDAGVWKRALRMRITGDFRIVGESQTQALNEQLEWFRARAHSVSLERAWESLRLSDDQQAQADWTRVANASGSNVEIGHVMLRASLPVEFREQGLAYEGENGKKLTDEQLVDALNAEPQRCVVAEADGTVRVRIIGWGTWAAFLQRHLCQAIVANFEFMNKMLGVRADAQEFRKKMDARFWGLRLYPFVRRQCATDDAYYRKAQDDEMAVVRRTPHHVPAEAWNHICYTVPFGEIYIPPPHAFINEWHRPNPPPGTVYNPLPRLNHPSLTGAPDIVARMERMHQLAPYDDNISRNLLRIRDGEKPTPARVEEVYASVLDYRAEPLRRLAALTVKDPATQEKWIRKAAALDPSEYRRLALFYVAQKREEEAAEAYTQWIANETDEVSVSNSAEWLVKYLERTGRKDAASNLADRMADAYSAKGLLTKARLLEGRQEVAAALKIYQAEMDRYDDPSSVIGFLLRLKQQGNTAYDELRDSLMKRHLPAGIVKFSPGNPVVAPQSGVRVHTQNSLIEKAGLRKDDVVVAIRGNRVSDWNGYKILRGLEPEEPYTLTIWRGDRYLEIPPLAPSYRFGIDLINYRAK